MKRKNRDLPPTARGLLNPFQWGTIQRTILKATEAREAAHETARQAYRVADPKRESAMGKANFDCALLILSTMRNELKAAGIPGGNFREAMLVEIQDAVNYFDLSLGCAKRFRDVLIETSDADS